ARPRLGGEHHSLRRFVRLRIGTPPRSFPRMPTTGIIEAKTAVPPPRSSAVAREAVLARLLESVPLQLVSVAAPAGYGKATLLSPWSEVDPRAFASLTLDERDNDPVLLLRYVLAALERSGAVAAGASAASSPRL